MNLERASGILLHPTSFPGPFGIGDLGGEAYRFVDFLQRTGQKLWQILPLAPTGYGDSPYASFSAFAGNPMLISPDLLGVEGLLEGSDLDGMPHFTENCVDYGPLISWKMGLLRRSYARFQSGGSPGLRTEMAQFASDNAHWLEDYALFMAVKAAHGGESWSDWEDGIALRQPTSLAKWRADMIDDIAFQKYLQFQFFRQWLSLKRYANERSVKVVGDIPIFVAYDSADVWAHPELFYLDKKGRATVVAGVPPDYFSAKGQYWGNPLYRWDVLAKTDYAWWVERFRGVFRLYDLVRLDHFRGFAAYWEVPVNKEQTAANGRWVDGPGVAFFDSIRDQLGQQPIIAEDLGVITPDVDEIRKGMGFPGMRVLQFAFGAFETDATDPYLPHNFEQNTVVYTGTHDNDTTASWYRTASPQEQKNVKHYLDLDGLEENGNTGQLIARKLVRLAFSSVANTAIVPLQDLLGVGSEGRMNWPGKSSGNWTWRYNAGDLSEELAASLRDITILYARYVPPTAKPLKGQGNV